jgi:hypothetical protein
MMLAMVHMLGSLPPPLPSGSSRAAEGVPFRHLTHLLALHQQQQQQAVGPHHQQQQDWQPEQPHQQAL